MEKKEEMTNLIARYLAGGLLKEEEEELRRWISSSQKNRMYFESLKNIWDGSDHSFDPGQINTGKAFEIISGKLNMQHHRNNLWFYWQRIAAILIIPVVLAFLSWTLLTGTKAKGAKELPVVYNTVTSAYGNRSQILLSDGTVVMLDSKSTLRYPVEFKGDTREVYLKGQAYFEVKSDESKPFIVSTNRLKVRATGTTFDVCDYDTKDETKVTLVSGKVAVSRVLADSTQLLLAELKPDQHLVYNSADDDLDIQQENAYESIAWKDGKLIFRNVPMDKVVEKLSEVFEVDIELRDPSLKNYRYRATFQDETLSEILKLLKFSSPIDYVELKRDPLPDGSFEPRKVLIFRADCLKKIP